MTSGGESMKISFLTQAGDADGSDGLAKSYLTLFESKKESEIQRKCCLCGAQRDDFSVHIKDRNAKLYASQGQQRSAVLSLKLAEGALSEDYTGDITAWCAIEGLYSLMSSGPKTLYINGQKIKNDLVIPDNVTSINSYAFRNCKDLISVTIGNGVTSIGESAFYDCDKLVEVYNKDLLEDDYYRKLLENW